MRAIAADIVDQGRGRAGEVRFRDDLGRAFGMRQHHDAGMGRAVVADLGGGEPLMHLAGAFPGDDLHAGQVRDVLREVLVRDHDHGVGAEFARDLLDHGDGIGRGAADVTLGFHLGRGVHIGHDRQAGIFLAEQAHIGASDRGRQRTAGARIGDQHGLVGRKDLRGLRHEMHAGLHDDLRIGARRLAREGEGVADEIGNAVENLRRHVVVAEDDRIPLALQAIDLGDQRREDRPFDLRDDMADFPVQRLGHLRDRGGVSQFDAHLPSPVLAANNAQLEYIYGAKRPALKGRLSLAVMLHLSINLSSGGFLPFSGLSDEGPSNDDI